MERIPIHTRFLTFLRSLSCRTQTNPPSKGCESLPVPMWAPSGERFVEGYMCLVDFECELGATDHGNRIYPDTSSLLEKRKCVTGCGIVKVRVTAVRIILPASE